MVSAAAASARACSRSCCARPTCPPRPRSATCWPGSASGRRCWPAAAGCSRSTTRSPSPAGPRWSSPGACTARSRSPATVAGRRGRRLSGGRGAARGPRRAAGCLAVGAGARRAGAGRLGGPAGRAVRARRRRRRVRSRRTPRSTDPDAGPRLWDACRSPGPAGARRPGAADRPPGRLGRPGAAGRAARLLREIAAHVRHRPTVFEDWGFGARTSPRQRASRAVRRRRAAPARRWPPRCSPASSASTCTGST